MKERDPVSSLSKTSLDELKLQRLKRITNEVAELHPLLFRLLRKLPGVRRVEKTHGVLEHGADFVLEREDLAIELPITCAVVAKCGNINKPDSHRVVDQVRECHGERLFWSGKRKVFVSEIWVATNGVVAEAAKRLIHDEFKATKIQFIDRDQLIRLIDRHLPSYWSDVDVSVGDYLAGIAHQVDVEDKELSLLPNIEQFYVEQDIVRFGVVSMAMRRRRMPEPEKVDLLREVKENRLLIIEGDAGAGKSKCSRELVKTLCDAKHYNQRHLIPIRVDCADLFGRHNGSLKSVISEQLASHEDLLNDPKNTFVIIADGLDELKQSAEEAAGQVHALADQAAEDARLKVVMLSRPFSNDFGDNIDSAKAGRLELLPLSLTKTIIFLKRICTDLAPSSRIFEDLKKSALFQQLPKTPIATILLARILREKQVDLPSTLPELYKKYFELALGRWDVDRGLQSEKEYEALNSILMEISEYLMENELDGLTYDEALEFFKTYLKTRNFDIRPEELLAVGAARCPILRVQKADNRFSFKHRTFVEFLFAKRAHELSGKAAKLTNVTAKAFEPYWMNSLYFYIGLQRDCPELLEQLIQLPVEEGIELWMKTFALSDFLLAGYATPYKVITQGIMEAGLSLSRIYLDITSGQDKQLELDRMPRMQLLWLMQYFFKHRYGYPFFEKAIPDAVETIVTSTESADVKAYAVFW